VRHPLHSRRVVFLQSYFYRLEPRASIFQKRAGELGHNVRLVFTLQPAQSREHLPVDGSLHVRCANVDGGIGHRPLGYGVQVLRLH
jgi:hypothetical protein